MDKPVRRYKHDVLVLAGVTAITSGSGRFFLNVCSTQSVGVSREASRFPVMNCSERGVLYVCSVSLIDTGFLKVVCVLQVEFQKLLGKDVRYEKSNITR